MYNQDVKKLVKEACDGSWARVDDCLEGYGRVYAILNEDLRTLEESAESPVTPSDYRQRRSWLPIAAG